MSLPMPSFPARPSTQAWESPDLSAAPRGPGPDLDPDLDGDSTVDEAPPRRSGSARFDAPLTVSARDALRERARFQAEQQQQQQQQQQQAQEHQFVMSYMNEMAQLVQRGMAMVNGSFMPMCGPMSLMPASWTPSFAPGAMAWPTWSPYGVASPGLPDLDNMAYFSPYATPYAAPYSSPYSPFHPLQPCSTAGAFGAGLLGAGAMGAGLLAGGLVANSLDHAVGSTFGGALGGLLGRFGW